MHDVSETGRVVQDRDNKMVKIYSTVTVIVLLLLPYSQPKVPSRPQTIHS